MKQNNKLLIVARFLNSRDSASRFMLLQTTLKNSLLFIENKRNFSASPGLHYSDGEDDFSRFPYLETDVYIENARGLDNEGNIMTPFRAEL